MGILLVFVRTVAVFIAYLGFALVGVVLRWSNFISEKRRHALLAGFTRHWARCSSFIFNINIRVVGDMKISPGSLIVGNHIGTPDIFVLGACFPGFFVSKAEIAEWPLFSFLARLGEPIFADRNKRYQVKEIIAQMRERLEEGCSVILFPEGRATDGRGMLDFKSSTFEAAVRTGSVVVPITIIYHDGNQPSIACWNDVTFFQHILRLLKNPRLEVTVFVHDPIKGETDRRVLAEKSWRIIHETHAKEVRSGD
ncbi:MAG: 1-acyl-sn-glycerol-3-phosphate acyltransferase [Nitrospinae bacterium]|nr:1-acyl-sn-glycerol-3-phosphate acyltransferase [Nitrospinota bacterium]